MLVSNAFVCFYRTGCSIPVVRLLWEQIDRVRFPAARHKKNGLVFEAILFIILDMPGIERERGRGRNGLIAWNRFLTLTRQMILDVDGDGRGGKFEHDQHHRFPRQCGAYRQPSV